jgi:hypothetical protein
MDTHPDALLIGIDFAKPVQGPTAGAIAQPLWATHRADQSGFVQHALTARAAVKHRPFHKGLCSSDQLFVIHWKFTVFAMAKFLRILMHTYARNVMQLKIKVNARTNLTSQKLHILDVNKLKRSWMQALLQEWLPNVCAD